MEKKKASKDETARALHRIADCLAVLMMHMQPFKGRDLKDKIAALYVLGFDRHQIAGVLGTTSKTVSTRLSEMGLTAQQKR